MLLNALEFNNLDFAIYELFSVLDPIVSTICQTISTWLVFLVRVYFPLDLLILKIELNLIPKYVACHHYVLMWQQHGLQPKMLNKTLHQTDQLNHLLVHLYLKKNQIYLKINYITNQKRAQCLWCIFCLLSMLLLDISKIFKIL